jgi:hypothetical protein
MDIFAKLTPYPNENQLLLFCDHFVMCLNFFLLQLITQCVPKVLTLLRFPLCLVGFPWINTLTVVPTPNSFISAYSSKEVSFWSTLEEGFQVNLVSRRLVLQAVWFGDPHVRLANLTLWCVPKYWSVAEFFSHFRHHISVTSLLLLITNILFCSLGEN